MVLEVNNLTKKIKGKTILDNISFALNAGEIACIVGPSGAGKTTLLRCINGLTDYEGQITVQNDGMVRPVTIVFQSFNLFPHLNVLDNLSVALKLTSKKPKAEIEEEASSWLARLGLSGKEQALPYQLSGGEKQRVAIARACMINPKVICFDEPTSALDPRLVSDVADIIKQLAKEGLTVLIITHDMAFAKLVSDKRLVLNEGKLIEQ